MLRIKLVRSLIGEKPNTRLNAKALGLGKRNSQVIRQDIPEIRGIVQKIIHLVEVEEIEE